MRVRSALLLIVWSITALGVNVLPQPIASRLPQETAPFVPGELIVGLADGVSISALNAPSGGRLETIPSDLEAVQAALVRVPAGKEDDYRRKLAAQPGVLFVEPNYVVEAALTPNDPLYDGTDEFPRGQWGPKHIQAAEAWDISTGSSSVILAILDSGVDVRHPEFAGRLLPGRDFVDNDTTLTDGCGHGTHVTGIAAATGNNSRGIAGMNWGAKVLPVRVLDDECKGSVAGVANGLVWAVDQGARVINMSLGSSAPSRLMEYATYYAYQRGAALFAASGNSGNNQVLYPARYPWVMAVGATNSRDTVASFSNFGAELDILAPGQDILSTLPVSGDFLYKAPFNLSNSYGILYGTSMATPHVSAVAALMVGLPKFDHPDKIYRALEATALDLGTPGWDDVTGYGLLQAADALNYDPSDITPPTPPTPAVEYDALRSDRCQNVTYAWVDVDHTYENGGTFVPAFGNDGYATVPVGFDFSYGGRTFNQATISANGYMTFDGRVFENQLNPSALADNFLIPLSDEEDWAAYRRPNWFLAPFWDDLNPSARVDSAMFAQTFGSAPNRRFVVEWYRVPIQAANSSTELTFQVILEEATGQIVYQYKDLKGPGSDGSSATLGLEYNDGYTGVLQSYNQRGAIKSGVAIHFFPQMPGAQRTTPTCDLADSVGSSGGLLSFDPWCLDIPSGLLPEQTTVRFSLFNTFPPAPRQYINLNRFVDLTLDPMPQPPFNPPPVVCYHYTAADLAKAGGHAANLFIAEYDAHTNLWDRLPTAVDSAGGRLTAPVKHFSVFGVFAEPAPEALPVTGAPARSTPWPALALTGLLGAVLLWLRRRA